MAPMAAANLTPTLLEFGRPADIAFLSTFLLAVTCIKLISSFNFFSSFAAILAVYEMAAGSVQPVERIIS